MYLLGDFEIGQVLLAVLDQDSFSLWLFQHYGHGHFFTPGGMRHAKSHGFTFTPVPGPTDEDLCGRGGSGLEHIWWEASVMP
jgi:hypothetical protein